MTAGIANHPLGINNRAIKVGAATTLPALVITNTSLPDVVAGASYAASMAASGAVTQPGRSISLLWSASGLPAGLTIDSDKGIIGGSTSVAAGSYPVYITVADGVHAPTTVGYMLQVASTSALSITTASLDSGQIGAAYSTTVAAANGQTPYQWSATVNGVAMPAEGLDISATTGVISGTPTGSPGQKTIVVTVTDSNNVAVPRTFTPNFAAASISITTSGAMTDAVNGDSSWSSTILASGGTGARTWSLVSGYPSGMDIGNFFGAGVTTGPLNDTAGNYNVKVKVVDSVGQSDTVTLTLKLSAAASSPPAFVGHQLGIVVPPATGSHPAHLTALIGAQPDLSIIRNQLDWASAQPSSGVDPDFTRSGLAGFRTRLNSGLDSLILVMSAPSWARPAGSGQHRYPTDPDDFGYFCGKAAEYIKAQKPNMRQRWEIFNEPNNAVFTDQVDPMSAAQIKLYARCLQAAYKAIKTVAPTALVSTGGTAPSPVAARKGYLWLPAVLDAMKAEYDATPSRYTKPAAGWHPWCACDRVSHHPYATGRFASGAVVDTSNNLASNAFGHDTPLMAQAVVTKVGVELIFWQTEAGFKNHQNATTGQGWIGGPYTKPHPTIAGKTENWDINSPPEAYAALNKALDQWFGKVNWPTGTNLAAWPDGNTRKSTRTEMYCYFHMGPDNFGGDFAISIDGMWDSNDVLKRASGGSNDLYEAFTTYVVP